MGVRVRTNDRELVGAPGVGRRESGGWGVLAGVVPRLSTQRTRRVLSPLQGGCVSILGRRRGPLRGL